MSRLRVAAIRFLNPAPLMWDFDHPPHAVPLAGRYDIESMMPAQCAEILSATHLQIDGEYVGRQTARLEIATDALTLLMPPEYR